MGILGSDTINGSSTQSISVQYDFLTVISNGNAVWEIISKLISVAFLAYNSATDTNVTGNGTFATVVFEGVSVGQASVDFDFSPGVRSDSNVAAMSSVDDSLSSTTGANYTIIAAESTPAALPKSGIIGDTLKLVGSGLALLLFSLLFL